MNKKQIINDGEKYTSEQADSLNIPRMTLKEFNSEQKKYDNEELDWKSQATWMQHVKWKKVPKQVLVSFGDSGYEVKTLWRCTCKMSDILQTQENLENILEYHDEFSKMYRDEFDRRNMWCLGVPYKENEDISIIYCWFNGAFEDVAKGKKWCPRVELKDTVVKHFKTHVKNPMKEFIENLEWDGERRLDTFLQKHYSADDTALNRVYFKRWMIALIKRIFEPGCKFDNMLLLQGAQGKKKTTLFTWLGELDGTKRWNNVPRDITNEMQVVYATRGKYILLCDDFDDMCSKDEIGAFKSFVTKDKTTAALKFKDEDDFPATYVIAGTTNQEEFLSDDKTLDERRFWIVHVDPEKSEFDLDDKLREQLFAEAYYYYVQDPKQSLWIWEPELIKEEIELQKNFKKASVDPLGDKIYKLFTTEFPVKNGLFASEEAFRSAVVETLGWKIKGQDNIVSVSFDVKRKDFSTIKEIPWSWIYGLLNEIGQRSTDRVIQILHSKGINAEKHKKRYNGEYTQCIIIK